MSKENSVHHDISVHRKPSFSNKPHGLSDPLSMKLFVTTECTNLRQYMSKQVVLTVLSTDLMMFVFEEMARNNVVAMPVIREADGSFTGDIIERADVVRELLLLDWKKADFEINLQDLYSQFKEMTVAQCLDRKKRGTLQPCVFPNFTVMTVCDFLMMPHFRRVYVAGMCLPLLNLYSLWGLVFSATPSCLLSSLFAFLMLSCFSTCLPLLLFSRPRYR